MTSASIRLRPPTWREAQADRLDQLLAGNFVPACIAWFAAAVVIVLALSVLWSSFLPGLPVDPGFTLKNYTDVFRQGRLPLILLNTAVVGAGTTLLVIFFAVPVAWLLHRTNVPLQATLMSIIAVAVLVPGFLKAIGWIMLASPQIGLLNQFLHQGLGLDVTLSIYGIGGTAFVQALSLTPTMLFLISGSLQSMDPALEEAAETSGANKLTTLRRVTFPLLWPAVMGGAIYTFMTAISVFEIPALLMGQVNGQVLSVELFSMMQPTAGLPRFGIAGVLALLMIVPSVIALMFYYRSIRLAHRYAIVTGKGYRPRRMDLGPWRLAGLAFVLLYVCLAVLFPFLVLLWTSLLPGISMPSAESFALISLSQYQQAVDLFTSLDVIRNTVVLVLAAPTVVMLISFMFSWIVVRTSLPGRRTLDVVAMMPHAIPGLAFAFSIALAGMLLSVHLKLPLYGSLALIIIANVINRLSYATRVTNAALLQVHAELEEAALVSGARKVATMWRIIVPLVRPSLLFGGLWTALLTFREVSMALMLSGPENRVLAVSIWNLWISGKTSQAAAAGVLMMVTMAVLFILAQRLAGRDVSTARMG